MEEEDLQRDFAKYQNLEEECDSDRKNEALDF